MKCTDCSNELCEKCKLCHTMHCDAEQICKNKKERVWRQPGVDNIPDTYWYADQVVVTDNPPKITCKCGNEDDGGVTLVVGQNWISCGSRHLMGTIGVKEAKGEEYMKENYEIIGQVVIGGVWKGG